MIQFGNTFPSLASIVADIEALGDAVLADDAAFTPATTKVIMAGFEYDDTTPDSVNEGDAGAARMSARRELYVQIRDAAGNERGVNVDASNQAAVVEASASAIKSAVEIMDDWDESDRAKVNPIVGQAGIAGGTGVDGATVPRVTLATDVGLPAGTNLMGKVGIDQTTPGTTNGVQVNAALPAGTNAIGKVDHNTTGCGSGRKTVTSAGTAEAIAGSTAAKWVIVQSELDNGGNIAVGGASVVAALGSAVGIVLTPGDSTPPLPCDNLADIYIDSTVNGEGASYIYGS